MLELDRTLRRTTSGRYSVWLDASKPIGQIEQPYKTLRNSVDFNRRFLSFSLQPDLISGAFLFFLRRFPLAFGCSLTVVFSVPGLGKIDELLVTLFGYYLMNRVWCAFRNVISTGRCLVLGIAIELDVCFGCVLCWCKVFLCWEVCYHICSSGDIVYINLRYIRKWNLRSVRCFNIRMEKLLRK